MDFSNLTPIFKEEIMETLHCTAYTARKIIDESGCSFKVGHKLAMPYIAFLYYLQGRKYTGIEIADGGSIHAVQ